MKDIEVRRVEWGGCAIGGVSLREMPLAGAAGLVAIAELPGFTSAAGGIPGDF